MIRFRFVWFSENSLSSDFPFFFFLFPALEQHQGPWHWLIPFRHTNSPSIVLISWFIDYFIYSFPREFIPDFFFSTVDFALLADCSIFFPHHLYLNNSKKKKEKRKKKDSRRETNEKVEWIKVKSFRFDVWQVFGLASGFPSPPFPAFIGFL